MSTQPTISLNNGNVISQLGFGVWQVPNEEAAKVVGTAISTGYRSIDTAAIYGNEVGVGKAIAASPVQRTVAVQTANPVLVLDSQNQSTP